MDNRRLKEIQQLKKEYADKIKCADSMYTMFKYQHRIDELEKEEIRILKRCDVNL